MITKIYLTSAIVLILGFTVMLAHSVSILSKSGIKFTFTLNKIVKIGLAFIIIGLVPIANTIGALNIVFNYKHTLNKVLISFAKALVANS